MIVKLHTATSYQWFYQCQCREANASLPRTDALWERLQQFTEHQESIKQKLLGILLSLSDDHQLKIRSKRLIARQIKEQLNEDPDIWRDEVKSVSGWITLSTEALLFYG